MLPRCSLALALAGRLPSFAACGPTLSLRPQTPRGTAEFLSSTGGGVCLPPALGPARPAARTELRGAQLRPLACHVGWEEGQDLPRPSQTVSSHNYPVSTSATLAQASRVLPRPSTQPQTAWLLGQQQNKMSGALLRVKGPLSVLCIVLWGLGLASRVDSDHICTIRKVSDCRPLPEVCC